MAEIIVALDLPTRDDALRLVDRLDGVRWVKIGPVLFVRSGPDVVKDLQDRGIRIFLDLKWHDIPHTVSQAVEGAEALGIALVTVHALGGHEMVEAAVRAASSTKVAAVTVLTSHTAEGYQRVVGREIDLAQEVVRLARDAAAAGVHAIVASPLEVAGVREVVGPDCWIVAPGIRVARIPADDQRRRAGPREAAAAGATHLVVGRPITRAQNPAAVYQELCHELS